MADQPRRLCVVASDWLRSSELVAALRASLRPQDPLPIIIDRRRGGSLTERDLDDRRCQPLVDLALATNGFAIVTASVDPEEGRTLVSLLLPEVPVDPLLPMEVEDRERLASIRSFLQRRSSRRIPKLGAAALKGLQAVQHVVEVRHAFPIVTALLAVLIGVTLAYMFQGTPPTVVGQAAAPPAAQLTSVGQPPARVDEVSTLPHLPTASKKPTVAKSQPARTEISALAHPASESLPSGAPASTKQTSLRDADKPIAIPPETSPTPKETGTMSRETIGRPSPKEATSKATRPRFAGSPRAVLAGEPVSLTWGKSYAVRLLNASGHPMAGAEVWLVARRTDGTGENIPMGALPEPGTYRATVPSRRSALIDLRVRVGTGDKRVEVPVKP